MTIWSLWRLPRNRDASLFPSLQKPSNNVARLGTDKMDCTLYASSITCSDFKSHLDSYPNYVPFKIQRLEELRLQEIPETLGKRQKDGDALIEKTEAKSLMEWKLYDTPPKDIPLQRSRRIDTSWKSAIDNANASQQEARQI